MLTFITTSDLSIHQSIYPSIYLSLVYLSIFLRNVMRDLTRLLYMLNKKPDKVRIPPDGIQILIWSEQILNRYLSAQVSHSTLSMHWNQHILTAVLLTAFLMYLMNLHIKILSFIFSSLTMFDFCLFHCVVSLSGQTHGILYSSS